MALLQAGLSAGTSLVSGFLGNRSAERASRDQFRMQSLASEAAYNQQRALNADSFNQQRDLNSDTFHQQRALNTQAHGNQLELLDKQNREVAFVNHAVRQYNDDILRNHSTNVTTTNDTSSSSGSIDFARMVKDAEAAGFNPLTVLRAGGLAGYSVTNAQASSVVTHKAARDTMAYFAPSQAPQAHSPGQAAFSQAPAAHAPAPGPAPQVNYGNPWGDAFSAGLAAYQANSPAVKMREALETGLARAQIANLQSDTRRNNLTPIQFTGSGRAVTTGGFGGAVRGSTSNGKLGGTATPSPGEIKVTNPFLAGANVDPTRADAAAYEERYGEILAVVPGAYNAIRDAALNLNKKTGNAGPKATEAASGYLRSAYEAMRAAWNSPAWNAK